MKEFHEPRKLVIAAAVFSALPLLVNPIISSADEKKAEQAAGYIGEMSKDLIASGMRERLEENIDNVEIQRVTGDAQADLKNRIAFWHGVALDSVALDHTPLNGGGAPFEQGGPTRTSRALAMIQIGVYEAVNALDQEYSSFTGANYSAGSSTQAAQTSCSSLEDLSIQSASSDFQFDDDYSPSRAIDNDLDTESRWSSNGVGNSIILDLGENNTVSEINTAWYKANTRTAFFDVQTSTDRNNWQDVATQASVSGTQGLVDLDVSESVARYVRIVGQGNSSSSNWNSLIEVNVFGCNDDDTPEPPTTTAVSQDAAVAQVAQRLLIQLYPSQRGRLRAIYNADMDVIRANESDAESVQSGLRLGNQVTRSVSSNRTGDGSNNAEPNFGEGGRVATGTRTFRGTPVNGGTQNTGEWTPDPNTPEGAFEFNLSLGAYWGNVRPFFLESGDQFRAPPPPELDSREHAEAFAETASLGGSPTNTNTAVTGTNATRFIGNFWGYDGVPLVGVPPRVYNQISAQIASARMTDPVEYARYLAMINTGMADVAIAAWDSKYFYNQWRPVTGIRAEDGNNATINDPTWNPVGVSVLNTEQPVRPTPPFPSYPSGHATFGAYVFEVMRDFFGDNTAFTFISDEFNGEGVDPMSPNTPRPLVPVRFESFTDAQLENGRSRVYNGVHWDYDNIEGQNLGLEIAHQMLVHTRAFHPSDSDPEQH